MQYRDPIQAAIVGILFYFAWHWGPKIKTGLINKLESKLQKRGLLKIYLTIHKIIKGLLYTILGIIILGIAYFLIWAIFLSK